MNLSIIGDFIPVVSPRRGQDFFILIFWRKSHPTSVHVEVTSIAFQSKYTPIMPTHKLFYRAVSFSRLCPAMGMFEARFRTRVWLPGVLCCRAGTHLDEVVIGRSVAHWACSPEPPPGGSRPPGPRGRCKMPPLWLGRTPTGKCPQSPGAVMARQRQLLPTPNMDAQAKVWHVYKRIGAPRAPQAARRHRPSAACGVRYAIFGINEHMATHHCP